VKFRRKKESGGKREIPSAVVRENRSPTNSEVVLKERKSLKNGKTLTVAGSRSRSSTEKATYIGCPERRGRGNGDRGRTRVVFTNKKMVENEPGLQKKKRTRSSKKKLFCGPGRRQVIQNR